MQLGSSSLRIVPILMGLVLISVGVLVYRYPQLLAYFVSGMFVFSGFMMILFPLTVKQQAVTYRRVETVVNETDAERLDN